MKSVKFLIITLALLMACSSVQAQFLKKFGKVVENAAKRTVENKADQKTEEAIDKATEPDTYKDKDGGESKDGKKSPSKKQSGNDADVETSESGDAAQDAFKRFGYYVPQPELDAPYGVHIRWELKQGKGEDGQPSESLHIEIRKKYDPAKLDGNPEKATSQVAFSDAEASAVAKFVQSCGAGKCGEGGVSPLDCNYFQKPDPQPAHTDKWIKLRVESYFSLSTLNSKSVL
jgi:hypothetical protein